MARLAPLLIALALVVAAPSAARAQGNAFGPLPSSSTPAPTATPTATPTPDTGTTGRTTLFAIGGVLLAGFAFIGLWIARDARRALPESVRAAAGRARDEGPHRQRRDAKARARARGRAQRAARRRNR